MALSDKSQMKLMKCEPPTMKQKPPPERTCDYGKPHKGAALSDKAQYSQMKRKGR